MNSIVQKLATEYGFDVDSCIRLVDEHFKNKDKDKKIPLPWCGVIDETCCRAVRMNYKLYTQCSKKVSNNNEICALCDKNGVKYGRIEDRNGDTIPYNPVSYASVIQRMNIDRADAEAFAKTKGLQIPEKEFTTRKRKNTSSKHEKTSIDLSLIHI